jgi:hypothetical protein
MKRFLMTALTTIALCGLISFVDAASSNELFEDGVFNHPNIKVNPETEQGVIL